MSKRTISTAVVAAVFTGILGFGATPALAGGEESQFVSSHNSIRSQHGRRTLAVASDLVTVARRHSQRMANEQRIWHNPNLTSEVQNWQVVGENVGMGPSVGDLMNAFMDSPSHRANILDTDYNQFGVGVVVRDGTIYVTVVFVKRSSGSGSTGSSSTASKPKPKPKPQTKSRPPAPKPEPKPAPVASAPSPAAAAPVASAPPVRTVKMLERILLLDA